VVRSSAFRGGMGRSMVLTGRLSPAAGAVCRQTFTTEPNVARYGSRLPEEKQVFQEQCLPCGEVDVRGLERCLHLVHVELSETLLVS
jgi:hypothetical protein